MSTELKLANQAQSDTTFSLVYGSKTTKKQYLNRLTQEQEVLKTKYEIYQRNEQIKNEVDENKISDLKKKMAKILGN
ncbi:hypothetical protein V8V50_10535 [Ligilactobacillus salivarius]